MSVRLTVTYKGTLPDGEFTYSEMFDRLGEEGPKARYYPVREREGQLKRDSMCYTGAGSDAEFHAARLSFLERRANELFMHREAERARLAALGLFNQFADKIREALNGLEDEEAIVLTLAHAVAWHDALEPLKALVEGMRSKELRKELLRAYREGKTYVRTEYPEDYREEEEKESFYESYRDDIAGYMAQELK